MLAGIKITCMTGSTGARVLWPAIADTLVIIGVTTVTAKVCIMVAWVIRIICMTVIDWRPAIG